MVTTFKMEKVDMAQWHAKSLEWKREKNKVLVDEN